MVCEEIWKGIKTSLSDYLDLSGVYLKIKKNVWILKASVLPDVLTPHSLEDPVTSEESRDEPKTFQESYDDINVDHLLNNYQLVSTDTYAHLCTVTCSYTCSTH